ncbi:MAG TPA: hypothetical protein VIG51_09840 [Candidatus Baltobacteraceae bacterium]|jgi:hypothetical protein
MNEREDHFQDDFTDNEEASPAMREKASHDLNLDGDQIDSQADDETMRDDRFGQDEKKK